MIKSNCFVCFNFGCIYCCFAKYDYYIANSVFETLSMAWRKFSRFSMVMLYQIRYQSRPSWSRSKAWTNRLTGLHLDDHEVDRETNSEKMQVRPTSTLVPIEELHVILPRNSMTVCAVHKALEAMISYGCFYEKNWYLLLFCCGPW